MSCAMTPEMVLDNCAVKLNGPLAAAHDLSFEVEFTDRGEVRTVFLSNGTLRHRPFSIGAANKFALTLETFVNLTSKTMTLDDAKTSGALVATGESGEFETFLGLLEQFDVFFAIIEP